MPTSVEIRRPVELLTSEEPSMFSLFSRSTDQVETLNYRDVTYHLELALVTAAALIGGIAIPSKKIG